MICLLDDTEVDRGVEQGEGYETRGGDIHDEVRRGEETGEERRQERRGEETGEDRGGEERS